MNIYLKGVGHIPVKNVGPMPPDGSDVWWSAKIERYANYDPFAEFEQPSGSHMVLEFTPYAVVKYTPKGVRLRGWLGGSMFVLGKSIRQLAVPTKELAVQDLIAKKEKHVKMAQLRADDAERQLEISRLILATIWR